MRRAAPAAGLLLLVASFVVGANLFGSRDALLGSATPEPRASAFSRIDGTTASTTKSVLRSQPWWQQVTRLSGAAGNTTRPVTIGDGAIQWRVTWRCDTGRFAVRTAGTSEPLIDASCGAQQTSTFTKNPEGDLRISAGSAWTAKIEQQVDVPLVEPPLAAMSAPGARATAKGRFYRIDQVGRGVVTIYRLASGRYALRLSRFYVTANIDLEIRLHPLRAPHSTRQYLSAPSRKVAPLDVTTGSMNFRLPAGVDPSRYGSVVIWCPLITSAYAAATLVKT